MLLCAQRKVRFIWQPDTRTVSVRVCLLCACGVRLHRKRFIMFVGRSFLFFAHLPSSFTLSSMFFFTFHPFFGHRNDEFENDRIHQVNGKQTENCMRMRDIIDIVWDLNRKLVFINVCETINCLLIGQTKGKRKQHTRRKEKKKKLV